MRTVKRDIPCQRSGHTVRPRHDKNIPQWSYLTPLSPSRLPPAIHGSTGVKSLILFALRARSPAHCALQQISVLNTALVLSLVLQGLCPLLLKLRGSYTTLTTHFHSAPSRMCKCTMFSQSECSAEFRSKYLLLLDFQRDFFESLWRRNNTLVLM